MCAHTVQKQSHVVILPLLPSYTHAYTPAHITHTYTHPHPHTHTHTLIHKGGIRSTKWPTLTRELIMLTNSLPRSVLCFCCVDVCVCVHVYVYVCCVFLYMCMCMQGDGHSCMYIPLAILFPTSLCTVLYCVLLLHPLPYPSLPPFPPPHPPSPSLPPFPPSLPSLPSLPPFPPFPPSLPSLPSLPPLPPFPPPSLSLPLLLPSTSSPSSPPPSSGCGQAMQHHPQALLQYHQGNVHKRCLT